MAGELTEKLEIAREIFECVKFYEDCRRGCDVSSYEFADHHRLAIAYADRVKTLEAAEKEAPAIDEPKHDLVLDRLAALERHFRSHTHDVPAVTGTTVTHGPTMH